MSRKSGAKTNSCFLPAKKLPQPSLRPLEDRQPALRQMLAGAVDVEIEHRHGGLEGAGLAAGAGFGRTLEGTGDRRRIFESENALLQIERVTLFCYFS